MSWILALKLVVIAIFLIMFLRRPSVTWGVGLLAVTTAVLLDSLLGTFNGAALRAELGFFYFFIAGSLFGGAAIWLWGLLLPFVNPLRTSAAVETAEPQSQQAARPSEIKGHDIDSVDSQMLYEEIHNRFGRGDILDLMFDLGINESDVMTLDQNLNQLIINIMNVAQQNGQTSAMALAVERILTPPPPDHLPRLEKISADSPRTIIRQYLLAHYNLVELEQISYDLSIDWEQLDAGGKKEKVRSLLQYLYRRNRINELVSLMQALQFVDDQE